MEDEFPDFNEVTMWRIDYMRDGKFYWIKFVSENKMNIWLEENKPRIFTKTKTNGSLVGG